jgi:hypothetical protein
MGERLVQLRPKVMGVAAMLAAAILGVAAAALLDTALGAAGDSLVHLLFP